MTKIIVCILLASLSAYALDKFEGTLLGVTAGGEAGSANTQISGNATALANTNISNRATLELNGVSGGILVGYWKEFNGLYVGIEGDTEAYSAQNNSLSIASVGGSISAKLSIQKKHTLSASFKIGKDISDEWLVYLKRGVIYSTYRLSSTVAINGATGIIAGTPITKSFAQPLVGVGVEHYICGIGQNINLIGGAEYTHVFARGTTLNLNSAGFNGATTFKPSSDALKVRLILRF